MLSANQTTTLDKYLEVQINRMSPSANPTNNCSFAFMRFEAQGSTPRSGNKEYEALFELGFIIGGSCTKAVKLLSAEAAPEQVWNKCQ